MNLASGVYQRALWSSNQALAYVRARGIPDWVIGDCGLGYADGHSLRASLRDRPELGPVAEALGLLVRPDPASGRSESYEYLRHRVVVPEIRSRQHIWFIGRSLEDRREGLKYLALPGERPVLGLERAGGQREVFLCEGVFDLLTAIAWNLPAFSICGTGMPDDRLGFLASTEVVYAVFDGDAAGELAMGRFAGQLGARVQPIHLPQGLDLNDLGQRPDGRDQFLRLIEDARQGSAEPVAIADRREGQRWL